MAVLQKKICTWELPTHNLQFVLFSYAIAFKWYQSLPQEKIPLCFARFLFLLRNNTKTKHKISVLQSNVKNLHTHFTSRLFLYYECVSWPSHKLPEASYTLFVFQRHFVRHYSQIVYSSDLKIHRIGQRVRCMWRNKELTPKGEDVKLITHRKHVPDTIG